MSPSNGPDPDDWVLACCTPDVPRWLWWTTVTFAVGVTAVFWLL
jgi:hypothetical protein